MGNIPLIERLVSTIKYESQSTLGEKKYQDEALKGASFESDFENNTITLNP